ncbi:hypothetical protein Bbelb_027910 [Branchiostoma belcheri]|nr:hypothetical protein Bbelb_027910 [Branchiostoma belcheri]
MPTHRQVQDGSSGGRRGEILRQKQSRYDSVTWYSTGEPPAQHRSQSKQTPMFGIHVTHYQAQVTPDQTRSVTEPEEQRHIPNQYLSEKMTTKPSAVSGAEANR